MAWVLIGGVFVLIGFVGAVVPDESGEGPGKALGVAFLAGGLWCLVRGSLVRVVVTSSAVVVIGFWRTRRIMDLIGVSLAEGDVGRGRGLWPVLHRGDRRTVEVKELSRYGTTIDGGRSTERYVRAIAEAAGVPYRLGPITGRGRSGWVSFF